MRDGVDALERVVQQVAASRRYRGVDPMVVRRIAALEARHARGKALVKAVKKHLHRIYGAYLPVVPPYEKLLASLRDARAQGEGATWTTCLEIMRHHASTRERVGVMEPFLAELEERVGKPERVLDLACGLQPLAWSRWRPSRIGLARDIDTALMAFLDEALAILEVPHQVSTVDLHQPGELPAADVILLLKALPCLRPELTGDALGFLEALPAPVLVVSFPTLSLGRRRKGMHATYSQRLEGELASGPFAWETFEVPGELVYVLRR